jgi:hypothetical protein
LSRELKPLELIAVTELVVNRNHRCMAGEACTRRIELLALGERLVLQHVGMAPALAVIVRESVTCPHDFQAGILLQLGTRHDRTRIGLSGRVGHGLAAAVFCALHIDGPQIQVILRRKIFAPDRGIRDCVIQFDHAIERISCLLPALKDVDHQSRYRKRCDCCEHDHERDMPRAFHYSFPMNLTSEVFKEMQHCTLV